MDEIFDPKQLSADDQAVLRAFDAMSLEGWSSEAVLNAQATGMDILTSDELLLLFIGEVTDDLAAIRRVLQLSGQDNRLDGARLQALQHSAHKIKGTAGAIGCSIIATIARHLEVLTRLIMSGTITPVDGMYGLIQTIHALEETLKGVASSGQESSILLAELEAEYHALNIDIQANSIHVDASSTEETLPSGRTPGKDLPAEASEVRSENLLARPQQEHTTPRSFVRIDDQRIAHLVSHTEQLAELYAPLENAEAEVEVALQELHAAEGHLRRLETLLASYLSSKTPNKMSAKLAEDDERSRSTLMARIVDESSLRTGRLIQRNSKSQAHAVKVDKTSSWDSLEIDQFSEGDVLVHSLSEAISDIATASSQLRVAIAQLKWIMQKQRNQAVHIRSDALLLRLTPLSTLVPRIERAIMMSANALQQELRFEVKGETTEIDQDILEALKHPLLQLVRTCMTSRSLTSAQESERGNDGKGIWLHAQGVGNEVTIEIGFSMAVGGGALDEIQESIRRLNGSISARRNEAEGISFFLRLPRSQGMVQGLLVRVGSQRVIVPFSQLQQIGDRELKHPDSCFVLSALLGFPEVQSRPETVQPFLILQPGASQHAVQVDEIVGSVELVAKSLASHLRRPGIAGTAIDGTGNVLLIVDLSELIENYTLQQHTLNRGLGDREREQQHTKQEQHRVLIVDDSVSMRQSLNQTLIHAGYQVVEARDGMEALEYLLDDPPDALLLDVEMPNLNGYDLLRVMRVHPQLSEVKIVMLTSRSSEKHQLRARELGAHAYLTKPCSRDTLQETLLSLLMRPTS